MFAKHINSSIQLLPFHASHKSLGACHREHFCLQLDPSSRVLYFPKKEIGHPMKRVPHLLYLARCFMGMKETNQSGYEPLNLENGSFVNSDLRL